MVKLASESADTVEATGVSRLRRPRNVTDPPRQYGIHLNAQLTLQTRKMCASVAPRSLELRAKYDVMGNMSLLAQLHQPGRSVFADLEPSTFQKFLKQLLSKQDINLQKERFKENVFRHRAGNIACLTTSSFEETRTSNAEDQHWNQGSMMGSLQQPTAQNDALVAAGEFGELSAGGLVARRSWRTCATRFAIVREHQTLAARAERVEELRLSPRLHSWRSLAPSGGSNQSQPKSRGRGKKGSGKGSKAGRSGRAPSRGDVWSFDDLLHGGFRVKAMFNEKNANNGICFASQEKRCESTNCPRLHICIGCGGPKAHNECHCLQPKINALPSGSA